MKKSLHPVTDKQSAILDFLRSYRAAHGVSPSIQEIANQFEVNCNAISCQLRSLEEKGAVKRIPGIARGLLVVEVPA